MLFSASGYRLKLLAHGPAGDHAFARVCVCVCDRPEQIMIYQVIEKAGNKGIWTRDIKTGTNVNQNTLTKTLKSLESRHLVKTAKSVTSKSKKLYMLYELSECHLRVCLCVCACTRPCVRITDRGSSG